MQTVIARFSSAREAETAINELNSYNLGTTKVAVKEASGHVQQQTAGGNGLWDIVTQLGIVACLLVGAFFGLLAGLGVFGHMEASGVSARTAFAGLLIGISIGMIAGTILGPIASWFMPERQSHFHPTSVQADGLVVAVQTQERWVRDAVNIMRNAHAVNVDTRKGKVDANKFAENMPSEANTRR